MHELWQRRYLQLVRGQIGDGPLVNVWDLAERGVLQPRPLDNHLHEVHGKQGRRHVALVRRHVYHRLQDANALVENRLGVGFVISNREAAAREMRLNSIEINTYKDGVST